MHRSTRSYAPCCYLPCRRLHRAGFGRWWTVRPCPTPGATAPRRPASHVTATEPLRASPAASGGSDPRDRRSQCSRCHCCCSRCFQLHSFLPSGSSSSGSSRPQPTRKELTSTTTRRSEKSCRAHSSSSSSSSSSSRIAYCRSKSPSKPASLPSMRLVPNLACVQHAPPCHRRADRAAAAALVSETTPFRPPRIETHHGSAHRALSRALNAITH